MTTSYYANVNPELLRWMPLAARDVLEIGCGEGALAAAYRRRNPAVRYTAIEAHGPAAVIARTRIDRLIEADFQALEPAQLDGLGRFDAVVMGDVLEHMADPWATLARLKPLLREDGCLALSVPNAGHWSVMAELLSGRWPAQDAGLFDRTHLRWFTLDSLRRLLEDQGFALARARSRQFALDEGLASAWIPAFADVAQKAGLDRGAFEQRARTLQWVTSAHKAERPPLERLHLHFAAMTPDFLDVRMRLPAEALTSDAGLDISYAERNARLPDLPKTMPKVAVVQRLAMSDTDVVRRYVAAAAAAGWVLVFELDDHPDLIGQVQRSRVGEQLRWTMRGFHAAQTSTERLGAEFSKIFEQVAVFSNAVLELPAFDPPSDRLRVFHGALNREGFTSQVASRLGGVTRRHPEVEFVVLHDRAFFDSLSCERKIFNRAQNYAEYLSQMARCDIVLSPLQGAPNELFKSDVKFVEASAACAATLASAPVYADTIVDGDTGLIAHSLDDWPTQLERLLDDSLLRMRLATNAHAYVRTERMLAGQVARRSDWYRQLWRDRDRLFAAAERRMSMP